MDILHIVALGLLASVLYIILKDVHASFAFFIVLLTSVFIFFIIIQQIHLVFKVITTLGQRAKVESFYLETIFKIIGIAYIAEIGAHITRDAGLQSVAANIELAGKVFILILAIPIITAVIEAILNFLSLT